MYYATSQEGPVSFPQKGQLLLERESRNEALATLSAYGCVRLQIDSTFHTCV